MAEKSGCKCFLKIVVRNIDVGIIQYCSTANWIEPNGAELKLVPVAMLTHIAWKFAKKRNSGKKRWKKDEKQHNEY